MKRDVKRQKLAEAKDVPGLVARVNEANAGSLRRRGKMMLPAPQVRRAWAGAAAAAARSAAAAAAGALLRWGLSQHAGMHHNALNHVA